MSNLCDLQIVRGEMSYVPGDTDDGVMIRDPGDVSTRHHDEGGGQGQDDRDVGGPVYSFVQCLGDEKGVAGLECSMKTGRLPRISDQKQTLGAGPGDGMFQNNRHRHRPRLQSRILLWEGGLQSENGADTSTGDDGGHRAHGMTGNKQNRRS